MEKKKEENTKRKKEMIERLEYLFSRLDVNEREKDRIIEKYPGVSDKALSGFQSQELEKYESLRKERMAEFIEKLIPEVKEMWEKLCLSDEEQTERQSSIEDKALPESEELLEAWESEMKRCQDYYESNQQIYSCLSNWRSAWETVEKIEVDEKNPDRYKSRKFVSTNFMREQQLKKQSEKTIQRLEKTLCNISDEMTDQGTPMTLYGIPLKQYVMSKRLEYESLKENERLAKKTEKAKQMFTDSNVLKKNQARGGNFVPRINTPLTPSKRSAGISSLEELSPTKRRNTPLVPRPISRQNTGVKAAGGRYGTSNIPRCPSQMSIVSVNEDEFRVSN